MTKNHMGCFLNYGVQCSVCSTWSCVRLYEWASNDWQVISRLSSRCLAAGHVTWLHSPAVISQCPLLAGCSSCDTWLPLATCRCCQHHASTEQCGYATGLT